MLRRPDVLPTGADGEPESGHGREAGKSLGRDSGWPHSQDGHERTKGSFWELDGRVVELGSAKD